MDTSINAGLVQIQNGAGFVVTPRGHIVTCAHVIREVPSQEVEVLFQAEPQPPSKATILRCDWQSDIALLQVDSLPPSVSPLRLGTSHRSTHHVIQTMGFPGIEGLVALPARGHVVGETEDNKNRSILVLESLGGVSRGFSGAPIWDDVRQCVIGMLDTTIQHNHQLFSQCACALSSELIQAVCEDLTFQHLCPYRGLAPYREEDAAFFFGRERDLEQLTSLLSQDCRFLTVLGPSGSGKSSVIQAGLIPLLRRGIKPGVRFSEIITYQPTPTPLDDLLRLPQLHPAATLCESLSKWKAGRPASERLALIVDPFEEVFCVVEREEQRSFIEQIVEIIRQDLATIIVVMRDDYYSDLASYGSLMQLLERQLSNISPLFPADVWDIVQKPAQKVDLLIEESLASTIVDETMSTLAESPKKRQRRHGSILPVLSYYLEQLFQHQQDYRLTFALRQEVGGLASPLTDWATRTFYALSPEQQYLARHIFIHLVVLGDEDSGVSDRKRDRFLSDVSRTEQEKPVVREVIEPFVQQHLLTIQFDEHQQDLKIGLTHEVLLQEWPLLQDWLREDRQFLAWHTTLAMRTRQWQESQQEQGGKTDRNQLLRGKELAIALDWLKERSSDLTSIEHAFIHESHVQAEQEADQAREAAFKEQQRQITFARHLAAQALLLQEQQPYLLERSLLLAVESIKRYASPEADKALRRSLRLLPRHVTHFQRTVTYTTVLFSSDGHTLAAAGEGGIMWWENVHSDDMYAKNFSQCGQAQAFALHASGKYMLVVGSGTSPSQAWLIEAPRGEKRRTLVHEDAILKVFFGKDEAITISCDGRIKLWSVPQGMFQGQLTHPGGITMAALRADGEILATVGKDQSVRIWSLSHRQCLNIRSSDNPLNDMAFHPDHPFLALVTGNTVTLWDWSQHQRRRFPNRRTRPLQQFSHAGKITALAFHPLGDLLITASEDTTIRIWSLTQGQEVQCYYQQAPVRIAHVHPDGTLLAAAGDDTLASVWNLQQPKNGPLHLLPHPGRVQGIAFHPTKPYLATTSNQGGVRLWQYGQFGQVTIFEHAGLVQAFSFHQFQERPFLRAAIEESSLFTVWDMTFDGSSPVLIYQHELKKEKSFRTNGDILVVDPATVVTFSVQGDYVAIANTAGRVIVWERHEEQVFERTERAFGTPVLAMTFSPDGLNLGYIDETGTLFIWEWQSDQDNLPVQLMCPEQIQLIAFSPDNHSVLTVSNNQILRSWDWKRQEQHLHSLHPMPILSLHVSQDNRHFLTVNSDQMVRIWRMNDGALTSSLQHLQQVQMAIFSPQGKYVATACDDDHARIWEAETGRLLVELEHDGPVYFLAFSHDEALFATASKDQHIRIWHLCPEPLIQEAHYHSTRNLTPQEWQVYFGGLPYQDTLSLGWREDDDIRQ